MSTSRTVLGGDEALEVYTQVLESMVEGVSLSDESGIIRYTNPAEDRIFGYERGELIGQHVSVQNTYPPEENLRIVNEVIEHLKVRGHWSGEFNNRKKDGTPFTTFARITAIEVAGRRYWVCVQEDTTERKQAEEAVRESEQRFRAVWEYAGDAMALSDPEGIVLAANPAYYELYGYSPQEVIGRSFAIIFPQEIREWAVEEYRRRFADPSVTTTVEAKVQRRDGSQRVVEARYTFVEQDGQRTDMISMIRDITERKQMEQALMESERELADFFENSVVGLHWVGSDGIILRANQAELDLLGYSREEYIGHSITEFHVDPEVIGDILRRLSGGEALHGYEARLRCKDGSIKHVLISSNVMWEEGNFKHTRCFTRDITERKKAEQELARTLALEQQARMQAETAVHTRDELLFVVSHDLRNPLAAMMGNAQLLARRIEKLEVSETEKDSLARVLQRVDDAASRMSMLISELMDFGALQEGHQITLQKRATDLVKLLQHVTKDCQESYRSHHVEFHSDVDEIVGEWDAPRLERVLSNLLANAVKYSPAGSNIHVRVSEDVWRDGGDGVGAGCGLAVFTVRDEGVGIPEDELPHIFEWFRRAKNVSARVSGAGIGLANARQIIEQHGGRISVESQEGAGSAFTVVLPLN